MLRTRRRGFTLIELIIVMLIIAILAGLGTQAFISSQVKSRDARRKANLAAIASALENYYNDKKGYPAGDGNGNIMGCGVNSQDAQICTSNKVFSDTKGTVYMQILPGDPIASQKYFYVSSDTNQYQIYTHIENSLDASISQTIVAKNINCATGNTSIVCNWGLSSPNTNP